MGCNCSKNVSSTVVKGNRISEIRSNVIIIQKSAKNDNRLSIINLKRNYFYVIQRKTWIIILDFLPYRDLCQARKLNKFLNSAAKNQNLLKKFYRNRKSSDNKSEIIPPIINTSQNINNHYNFTTINNISGIKDLLSLDLEKYLINHSRGCSQGETININTNLSFHHDKKELKNNEGSEINSNDSVRSAISLNSPTTRKITSNKSFEENFQLANNLPYVDLFTKKEIDLRLGKNFKNLNENASFQFIQSCRSQYSCEVTSRTNKTPSFTGEILFFHSDDGDIISHRNKNTNLNINFQSLQLREDIKLQYKNKTSSKFQSAGNSEGGNKQQVKERNSLPFIKCSTLQEKNAKNPNLRLSRFVV